MRAPIPARLLLLAMVCLVAAACGGSGDDTSGTAPATTTTTTTAASGTTAVASQACADAAALKTSVAELDQLDPPAAGKAGIQAALDKVSTNLAALKTSAKSQWSSQITELDSAVEALKTTIAGINGDSLLSALPTIISDLKRIDTAWTALQQQIDQDCG
jgi:long-subunit fatty acid transport protein